MRQLRVKPTAGTLLRGALQDLVLIVVFVGGAAVLWPKLPVVGAVLALLGLLPVADAAINSMAYLEADSEEIRYLDYIRHRRCRTRDVSSLRMELGIPGGFSQPPKILNLLDSGGAELMQVSAGIMPASGIAQLAGMLGKSIGGDAAHLWLVDSVRRTHGQVSSGDLAGEGDFRNLLRRIAAERRTGGLELLDGRAMQAVYLVRGRIVKQIGLEEGEPLPRALSVSPTHYRFTPSALPQREIDLIAGCVDEDCYRPPL